jgi:peptidoglycan/xylan/chitin deacetylase (PgdA/CDA1 family)
MSRANLKVAFLIGRKDASTEAAIARVCESDGIEAMVVLVDAVEASRSQRWRNLRRNIRREGVSYIFFRMLRAACEVLESWVDGVIPQEEVEQLLQTAFPERGLDRLAMRYGFRVFEAGNLNGARAIEILRSAGADLGIVLGTRVLKEDVFAVPRLGCVNLHKGRVPEYRGMPPGFWELYDGRESAGVTIHFVDRGLDTGDVLDTSEVPIHPKETPESLRKKLDHEGVRLLGRVVEQIRDETAVRRPQPKTPGLPRTRPTRTQRMELARRLPHWRRLGDGRQAVKMALWLVLFHGGAYSLVRRLRGQKSRGAILLYHRVNDDSEDVLTASTRRFAEHLVALHRQYRVIATEEMVERIAKSLPIEPTSVAIHFDDCYRDVRTCASPLLAAAGVPAVAFVSSGFVDTARVFRHDEEKYPQRFENFRAQDLRDLPGFGVSVAAHTVNHADLGSISLEQAQIEVLESRRQLEELTSRVVLLFSFPFGRFHNIREEVRQMVMAAGYRALFSAQGGFVNQSTPLFDIPRIPVSSDHSPLALMMELEGLSVAHFTGWLAALFQPGRSA